MDLAAIDCFVKVAEARDMVLTDAGAEFPAHACRIPESCDDAEAAVNAMCEDAGGALIIGSTGEFGTSSTSELLFALRERCPQVRIDVVLLSEGFLLASERLRAFDGNLDPVLPQWRPPAVPVNLLYPRRRFVPRKFEPFQPFCTGYDEHRSLHYVLIYCAEIVRFPKFQS